LLRSVAEDLQSELTLANYQAYLKNGFGNDADEFLACIPRPALRGCTTRLRAFETDYAFGYWARSTALKHAFSPGGSAQPLG